jgi:hypothetical protein
MGRRGNVSIEGIIVELEEDVVLWLLYEEVRRC